MCGSSERKLRPYTELQLAPLAGWGFNQIWRPVRYRAELIEAAYPRYRKLRFTVSERAEDVQAGAIEHRTEELSAIDSSGPCADDMAEDLDGIGFAV
jgi:hypothetical protein